MRAREAYVSRSSVVSRDRQAKSDTCDYKFNWNDFAVSQGTTLSSVAYSTQSGGLTAASNSVTSGVATVTITFSSFGKKNVKMIGTMADGTTHTRNIIIDAYDPDDDFGVMRKLDYGL